MSTAQAATLPFYDGFDPPQSSFANWTTTRVNGANTLVQSGLQAWDQRRSLRFSYAGTTGAAQAAAVVDFSSPITTPFVRFWLFVPAGTAASMGSGTTLRLVRLGDALTGAAGSGGAAKVNLALRKDPTGPLHLRLEYVNLLATVTTYGTALTTPITEGTWHYVELGYEPAVPRVRVFIDDPLTARIDAAPLDLAAHSLRTCWVGLADAADAQASPIALFLDEVAVAAAQTGTAQAIAQHFNELESGTLALANTPPGKAASLFTAPGVTAGAAPAAAHRGSYGLRVADSDGQAGPGVGAGQTVRLTATGGTLHRRFFWRPASTNGLGSRTIATLSSTGLGSRSIAEVVVAGNGTLSLGGFDASAAYVTTASASVASTNGWHLVELVVTGVGTASGTRKLYLDGTLAAQRAGVNWTGVGVDFLLDGQSYSADRAFQGIDDFDDLRVSRTLMPSRLAVTAPALTDRACSAAIAIEARDSDSTPRPVPEPTQVGLAVAGVSGTFYGDPGCVTAITSVALAVGTAAATVYFKPSSAGPATISALNPDYLAAPDTAAVASLATRLGFAGGGQTVSAGACSAQVLAQAQDPGAGAATVGVATTVGLASSSGTMGFFSDPACVSAVTTVIIPAGQSTAGFYFRDTLAAVPTITLSAPGLSPGGQAETIIAASPSKLVFFTPPRTAIAAACSAVVTVQSQDTYGNPANVTANRPVSFSSSSTAAAFFTNAGCSAAGATANLQAGTSTVSIYFTDTRAGTPTLTASAAGFLNGTQGQTIGPAAPARLAFSSAPQTLTAGACSGLATVEAQDAFGNSSQLPAEITLAFSAVPSTVTFFTGAGCTGQVTSRTMAAGSTSSGFFFISSAAGTVTLTVASAPLTSATQPEVISASGPTRLVFISAPQNVAAGSCSSAGLIQAQDSFGNPASVAADTTVSLTTTSATLRFSPTGACASAVTAVTLPAGNDTTVVYFKDTAAGTPSVTATAAGLTPGIQGETIRAAPPSQLAFATPPATLLAGACSAAIIAEARDGFGNPSVVVSVTAVALASTGAQGAFYSNAGCTTAITQSAIPAGMSGATFYYRDTRTGTKTLTASNPGLTAPTQPVTIDPAPPAKLVFTTAAQSLTAGSCSAPATVQVRDGFDNLSPVTAPIVIALGSSSASTAFQSNPACSAAVGTVGLSTGGSEASFHFLDPKAGAAVLTASSAGLLAGTQAATFTTGPRAQLAFVNPSRTVAAGGCSAVLTAQAQDATGNRVAFSAPTAIALSTSSATGALYADAACATVATQVTVPAGQSEGSFYFLDTKAGPWGVTATAASLSPAAQTVTVISAPAAGLEVLTAAQTINAGACSEAMRVELEDALGNPIEVTTDTPLALSSSSATTAFFLDAACTSAAASAVVATGASTAAFYFSDSKAGAPALTITAAGLPPVSQSQTIKPAAPSKLAFTTPARTVSAKTCSEILTVEQQDPLGNPAPQAAAISLDLASSSAGNNFYSDPACTAPVVSVPLAAGATTGSFYFKDITLGAATLTASGPALTAAVQQATIVTPGAPAKLTFATAAHTHEASACSQLVIVEVKDQNGNSSPVTQPTELTLTATSPTVTFHASGACGPALTKVLVPVGAYQALFHFREPVAHKVTLRVAGTGLGLVSQEQTVTCPQAVDGAACDDLDLCNGRETCVAGACTAGTPAVCDDGEACTIDSCVPETGCAHQTPPGCCRSPSIATANLTAAAVGVRYRIGPLYRAVLVKGTGPIRWSTCDAPPAGLRIDATTGEVDWVPVTAGAQPICLKATGPCGEDSLRLVVDVLGQPGPLPVASFTLLPEQVELPAPIAGDAEASTGTGPLWFEWSWGDGTPLTFGALASHTFAATGSYQVRLAVYDVVGQRAEAVRRVLVSGPGCAQPPVAKIAADAFGGDGSFAAALRCDCTPAPANAVFWWDFGDGSSANTIDANHVFAPGAYQVRLRVSAGGCSSEDTVEVRVTDSGRQPPSCGLTVNPAAGPAPLPASFAARFSGTSSPIASAGWSFSDGLSADAMANAGEVSRTLDAPGTLEARLVVTDEAGLSCRAAMRAQATSLTGLLPPKIVTTPEATGRCGQPWQYSAAGRPLATGSAPITWSLGKNTAGAGHPAGMTIDAATGELSWTPDEKTKGPIRVTVLAQNEAGVAEQDFLVEVDCATKSCGCGSAGFGPGLIALAGWLLLLRRRRRD